MPTREHLTRRNFIKILAAWCGSAVVSACGRPIPTSPAPASIEPIPVAAVVPTGTRTPVPSPTITVTATATATPTTMATAAPAGVEFIAVRGDQFVYRGARFPIKGLNYYPRLHPWRTFNIGDWDARAVEFELGLAAGLGANTVRTFVDYQFSLDSARASQPKDAFFAPIPQYVAHVREFLDIADRVGLKVIVTLFDSMDWVNYLAQNQWIAEEYLKELIPPFANDPRILCWDLQNEPDRAIYLIGNTSVIPFFQRMSALVRKLDPGHLQTIGWIDRARGKYFRDLDGSLDFWCFHFYDSADRLNDLVQFYKTQTAKPVLLEEFGLATHGQYTEQDQLLHYHNVLTTLEENGMCGSAFWILTDFPVGLAGNPPSPNDSPENHFGVFRLDYSEKPAAAELRSFWKPRRSGPRILP